MSNIFIGLKKTCLGILDRGDRDKGNEIGLKEGGGIEMSTTVLHSRCSLLRLNTYLYLLKMPFRFRNRRPMRNATTKRLCDEWYLRLNFH